MLTDLTRIPWHLAPSRPDHGGPGPVQWLPCQECSLPHSTHRRLFLHWSPKRQPKEQLKKGHLLGPEYLKAVILAHSLAGTRSSRLDPLATLELPPCADLACLSKALARSLRALFFLALAVLAGVAGEDDRCLLVGGVRGASVW